MKKILLIVLTVFMTVFTANAQIKEDILKSKERAEKMQSLCNGHKSSGNANVDEYGEAVKKAALFSVANSIQLENMYKRQIGETEDGVTDITIKKPTLEDWITFATTLTGEAASIKNATDKIQVASDEAKKMTENAAKEKNPMKLAKSTKIAKAAASVLEFGNSATLILLEENAAKVKAVNTIITDLKSNKNL